MDVFRSPMVRKLIAASLLCLGLSAQAQVVFACDLQNGAKNTTCCCEGQMSAGCDMGGGCVLPAGAVTASCCDIGLDAPLQMTSFSAPAVQAAMLQQAPQPPPAILHSGVGQVAFDDDHSPQLSFVLLPWQPGTRTYLNTLRLRI